MNARRYPIIIEQIGTGYSAYSPDPSGVAEEESGSTSHIADFWFHWLHFYGRRFSAKRSY